MVIGPTPPGTGVIALAFSLTVSNSTSPTILSPTLLIPTSMIIEFFFTQSPFTKLATPTAATRISAFWHSLYISSVHSLRKWY